MFIISIWGLVDFCVSTCKYLLSFFVVCYDGRVIGGCLLLLLELEFCEVYSWLLVFWNPSIGFFEDGFLLDFEDGFL